MGDAPDPTPEEQKKRDLLRLIADAATRAPNLEALGQDVVQFARLTRDVAPPFIEIFEAIPADALTGREWDAQLANWRGMAAAAQDLESSLSSVNTFTAVTNTVISMSASGVFNPSPHTGTTAVPPSDPAFAIPRTRILRTLERFPLAEKAKQSMTRLGLTVRGGSLRSPSDHLDEACGAMQLPVVPDGRPTSALLPLRECIDAALAELIRRRPTQAPAQGWKGKVISLGQYCSRPGHGADHFERLGEEADRLMNLLSGSKQANHTRDRVSELFHQGLMHLNGLLDSIDETKLRPA